MRVVNVDPAGVRLAPLDSSVPIPPEELLEALKFSREQTEAIMARMREADALSRVLAATDGKRWRGSQRMVARSA